MAIYEIDGFGEYELPDGLSGPQVEETIAGIIDQETPGVIDQVKQGYHNARAGANMDTAASHQATLDKGVYDYRLGPPETAKRRITTLRDDAIGDSLSHQESAAKIPHSKNLQKVAEAEGFGGAIKAFADAPIDTLVDAIASSAYPMAEVIGKGMAGGALLGPAGMMLGTAQGSYSTNFDSKFMESLSQSGYDLSTKEGIIAALNDRDSVGMAIDKARKYGGTIAAFDTATMGLASKTFGGAVRNAFTQTGIQSAGGAGGEAAGSYLAEGKINPGEVLIEGLAEIPGGMIDPAIAGYSGAKTTMKDMVDKKLKDRQGITEDEDFSAIGDEGGEGYTDMDDYVNSPDAETIGNAVSSSDSELDNNSVPESTETIEAGIDSVRKGDRTAAFTADINTLGDLEDGLIAVPTKDGGAYIVKNNDAWKVIKAEREGSRGEVLGMLQSKQDVEKPVIVQHKDEQGRTIADEVVDESRLEEAVDTATDRTGAENVQIKSVDDALAERTGTSNDQSKGNTQSSEQMSLLEAENGDKIDPTTGEIIKKPTRAEEIRNIVREQEEQLSRHPLQGINTNAGLSDSGKGGRSIDIKKNAQPQKTAGEVVNLPDSNAGVNDAGTQESGIKLTEYAKPETKETAKPVDQTPVTNNESKQSTIDDVGEKIGGAKKDTYKRLVTGHTDDEIASLPLSKTWPKPNLDKFADKEMAALVYAARAEVPNKPRSRYKVKRWAEKVIGLRNMLKAVEKHPGKADELIGRMQGESKLGLQEFAKKLELYKQLEKSDWGKVEKFYDAPSGGFYDRKKNNEFVKRPWVSVNGKSFYYEENYSEVLPEIVEYIEGLGEAPKKKMAFEIRGNSRTGYFINKKGDREYRHLKDFESVEEARKYKNENHNKLIGAWDKVKQRDNVSKADMRNKENRPRTGQDHRKGEDVSADNFMDTFGFRGVEFGNWVKQGKNAKERQGMINQAYDALKDLANIIGVPDKAISLNGDLAIAFGARGGGNYSAHYEPGKVVINLTKTKGAGALAHEWFHALDNYFQKKRPTSRKNRESSYITYLPETYYQSDKGFRLSESRYKRIKESGGLKPEDWTKVKGVRPEVENAFADLVKALDDSPMRGRAAMIDAGKKDGYWSRIIERAARSFENYVVLKMGKEGYSNDYLSNVKTGEDFKRDIGRYPYLLEEELPPIEAAFDKLFKTVKTKKTDKGVAMFTRKPDGETTGAIGKERQAVRDTVRKAQRDNQNLKIKLVPDFSKLPSNLKDEAYSQGAGEHDVMGVYHNGAIYVVENMVKGKDHAETILFHELFHAGISARYGKEQLRVEMRKLFKSMGGLKGIQKYAKSNDIDLSSYIDGLINDDVSKFEGVLADELVAHMAQDKGLADSTQTIINRIRELLARAAEAMGLKNLAERIRTQDSMVGEVLRQASKGMIEGRAGSGLVVDTKAATPEIDMSAAALSREIPESLEDLTAQQAEVTKGIKKKAKDWLEDKIESGKSPLLASLTLRQMVEVGGKYLPQLDKYQKRVEAMLTRRNQLIDMPSKLANSMYIWSKKPGSRKMAKSMFDIAHRATIAGYDPDVEYKTLTLKVPEYMMHKDGGSAAIEVEANIENLRKLQDKRRRLSKNDVASYELMNHYSETISDMKARIGQERKRAKAAPKLQRDFNDLNAKAKGYYREMRDTYVKFSEEMEAALIADIEKRFASNEEVQYSDAGEREKAMSSLKTMKNARIKQVRQEFEAARVEGPYFPLQRFGEYITIVKRKKKLQSPEVYRPKTKSHFTSEKSANAAYKSRDDLSGKRLEAVQDGERGWLLQESGEDIKYLMYDSPSDQRKDVESLEADGWEVTKKDFKGLLSEEMQGASEGFVADVITMLQKDHGDKSAGAQDQVYQMYLSTLPYLSARKHFIHRKKTAGFSDDAVRAYAFNTNHQAHQISKLEAAPDLAKILDQAEEHTKGLADATSSTKTLNELKRRHDWVMNPTNAGWTNTASAWGFGWYLGATPGAAIVNLTQTAIIGVPVLGAKHGNVKAFAALNVALKDVAVGYGRVERNKRLSKDERQAFKAFADSGVIDRSQAHNLAGISERDSVMNSPGYNVAMEAVGFMFHNAEVINRETTLLAAYRLARKSGESHQSAVAYAEQATWETHFDYSNANRARVMQGDFSKLFLMFRSYSQHMTYLLVRNFHQMLKGETKQVRKEAMNKLLGTLTMTFLSAGVTGLPLMSAGYVAVNTLHAIFNSIMGDEDDNKNEPWDAETQMRRQFAKIPYVGAAIDRGVVNAATGMDLASRVSLNDIWFRSPNRDLSGRQSYDYWIQQIAGPVPGIVAGMFKAADYASQGDYVRAAKSATPKALRDAIKWWDYDKHGVLNRQMEPIVDRSELNDFELFMQGMGMSIDKVNIAYAQNTARKNYTNKIQDRRGALLTGLYMARWNKDKKREKEIYAQMRRFNKKNPQKGIKIDKATIDRSMRSRGRNAAQQINGTSYSKAYRPTAAGINFAQ